MDAGQHTFRVEAGSSWEGCLRQQIYAAAVAPMEAVTLVEDLMAAAGTGWVAGVAATMGRAEAELEELDSAGVVTAVRQAALAGAPEALAAIPARRRLRSSRPRSWPSGSR